MCFYFNSLFESASLYARCLPGFIFSPGLLLKALLFLSPHSANTSYLLYQGSEL